MGTPPDTLLKRFKQNVRQIKIEEKFIVLHVIYYIITQIHMYLLIKKNHQTDVFYLCEFYTLTKFTKHDYFLIFFCVRKC